MSFFRLCTISFDAFETDIDSRPTFSSSTSSNSVSSSTPFFLIVESFRILCKQSSLGFEFDKGSRGF